MRFIILLNILAEILWVARMQRPIRLGGAESIKNLRNT